MIWKIKIWLLLAQKKSIFCDLSECHDVGTPVKVEDRTKGRMVEEFRHLQARLPPQGAGLGMVVVAGGGKSTLTYNCDVLSVAACRNRPCRLHKIEVCRRNFKS